MRITTREGPVGINPSGILDLPVCLHNIFASYSSIETRIHYINKSAHSRLDQLTEVIQAAHQDFVLLTTVCTIIHHHLSQLTVFGLATSQRLDFC
jgi:hypothetical protein